MNVLITGGSRGIGAACARLFAKKGYRVALNCCAHPDAARAVADGIRQSGGEAAVFPADVSSRAQVQKMVEEIEGWCSGVDVLVNNAGIAQQKLYTDLTDDDWNRMFAVNLNGVHYCCQAVLPRMIRRRYGRIVNISSIWGDCGGSCEVHYSAAKAAVIGFTKALAREEGLSGITVNCVAPGVIETEMNRGHGANTLAELAEESAVGRLGRPEEVAAAVEFLAQPGSGYITGQLLHVGGGFAYH